MPIYYPDIVQAPAERRRFSYSARDSILYALGIGFGSNPLDERELPFVYEEGLQAVPTMVASLAVAAHRDGILIDEAARPPGLRESSTNRLLRVHGAQKVQFHGPIAPAAEVILEQRISDAFDKGPDKGALVVGETLWRSASGELAATISTTSFCRGDGGFGGPPNAPEPHRIPERAADTVVVLPTRPDAAILFRLSGDLNPIHVNPGTARRAGFPRPILHGLATFGMAFRALLRTYAEFDASAVASLEARFSAPVLPGDTLAFDLWKDGDVVSFSVRVPARQVVVLSHGRAVLR